MHSGLRDNWALFFGVAMIMVGNGLLGTLLTIRGLDIGFSTGMIAFIQLGYPAGALLGTLFVPRIIAHVGHVRTFSALASICSAAAIVHLMSSDLIVWTGMRVLAGICFPGLYVITESWLNAKASNSNRAQLLSLYFVTQSFGSAAGVWMAGLNDLSGTNLFALVSIILSLSLVPLLLSARPAPNYIAPERMSLIALFRVSPMAFSGAILSGALAGSLFVGFPIYALKTGASAAQASSILALTTLIGAFAFFPAGWVSDRIDRRYVVFSLALGAALVSVMEAILPGRTELFATFSFFAAFSTPIYAICLAHGNDQLRPSQIVPASGAMVFVQNIGILIGFGSSPLSSEIASGRGYPGLLAVISLLLIVITLIRRANSNAPKESGTARATTSLTAPQTGQLQSDLRGNQQSLLSRAEQTDPS